MSDAAGQLVAIAVRSATRVPMETLDRARVTLEQGVDGEFRGKPGPRQVTVLAEESWSAACAELGEELPWTLRRANLLVRGVDLEESVGSRLRVGGTLLEVTEETAPCRIMDLQHEGLRAALTPHWRGGVCARVVEGGEIAVGDAAGLVEQADD